jgi:NAD(P)-dependent dehydrogenase (short-subunit alcohol dehydrogenase family)
MTALQHKIGSGFGATSTADEVMAGIDLTGKLAIVTGGYSGIGLTTTKALTSAGAHVIVPARRLDTAGQALDGIDNVTVDELDLGDLDSVRGFAERFRTSDRGIDMLINSAGIMACPETRVGPGWEAQFAVNHLGHYALVNRLWPAINPGARVVSVSSRGHHFSGIRWDDVQFHGGYHKWQAYGQAKTANILFAVQLDALAKDRGVRAFALHPGAIMTNLGRHLNQQDWADLGATDEAGNVTTAGFKSPEQGAATQLWAATSPQLDGMGGLYLDDCEVAEFATEEDIQAGVRIGVRDYAIDPAQAARLWQLSAELTGVNAFA